MNLSLNEIEATAKKAARGAGYPWGLAEEAGKATRWLCSHDVDGCGTLAELLEQVDGKDIAGWLPNTGHGPWAAKDGILCPLATGAAISDYAHEIPASGILLEVVASPMLLVPFAALLAQEIERPVTVAIGVLDVCTDGEGLSAADLPPHSPSAASICIGGAIEQTRKSLQRASPDPDTWEVLLAFAHRTYAPATEESRLRGAGAGLSDND